MFSDYQNFVVIASVVSAVWALAIYINAKINKCTEFLLTKIDMQHKDYVDKLEYHERHDDQRFGTISDALWSLKVDVAKRRDRDYGTPNKEE